MIAERIRALREQAGMTQSELARGLGITRSSVNAWEMGISAPSTQYVLRLAEIFQVSTDYLLGRPNTATVSVAGLNEDDIQLVHTVIDHLRKRQSGDTQL